MGYGVKDQMFDDIERGLYKYMPNGNKEELFKEKPNQALSRDRVLKKSSTTN